jgi:hypothetical protein
MSKLLHKQKQNLKFLCTFLGNQKSKYAWWMLVEYGPARDYMRLLLRYLLKESVSHSQIQKILSSSIIFIYTLSTTYIWLINFQQNKTRQSC